MDAVFLYIKPEYHWAQASKAHRGGTQSFALEWQGGERHSAIIGEPMSTAELGRRLLGTQEFSLLAGVHGGVHVIWVVPWLIPTRLVGGFGHDGLVTLAGHQCAMKNKQKQDWESCGDCLMEGTSQSWLQAFLNMHLIIKETFLYALASLTREKDI